MCEKIENVGINAYIAVDENGLIYAVGKDRDECEYELREYLKSVDPTDSIDEIVNEDFRIVEANCETDSVDNIDAQTSWEEL